MQLTKKMLVALCFALALTGVDAKHHSHHRHHRHHLRKADKEGAAWGPFAASSAKPHFKAAVHKPKAAVPAVAAKVTEPPAAVVAAAAVFEKTSHVLRQAVAKVAQQPEVEAPLPKVEEPEVEAPLPKVEESEATPVKAAEGEASVPAAVDQLKKELVEVKQLHENVGTVEATLENEVSLLRETATLQRLTSSPKARGDVQKQLHQTESVVKEMESMVLQSRENSVTRATSALGEATEVKQAAEALAQEAKAELAEMEPLNGKKSASMVEAASVLEPKATQSITEADTVVEEAKATEAKATESDTAGDKADDSDDDDDVSM